jgi:hypothetical protein
MTERHQKLIACGILKKEVDHLFEGHSWSAERQFLSSSLHFDFEKLHKGLSEAIEQSAGKEVILLYGTCHPAIDSLPVTRRTPCQNCIEMLLESAVFNYELGNGAYFLLEEWALDWENILKKTFGTPQVAREIFQEDRRYLLALRTPCSRDFSAQAEAAAAAVGLPLRWMDVTLNHLEKLLSENLACSLDHTAVSDTEVIADLKKKLEFQEQRANRIAAEKSYLQLVSTMMSRLSALPGLEKTLHNLLELVVDSLGGTYAIVYYTVDGQFYFADLNGLKGNMEVIADPLVLDAFHSGQSVNSRHAFADTLMHTSEFTSACTWFVPLLTGNTTVGVIKIENMHLESEDFLPKLEAFFRYAALILKNEIQNYVQLQESLNKLKLAESQVKKLEGIIPICIYCKKIRDDQKSWHQLETYITEHSDALFSHGMCPGCAEEQMKIIEHM